MERKSTGGSDNGANNGDSVEQFEIYGPSKSVNDGIVTCTAATTSAVANNENTENSNEKSKRKAPIPGILRLDITKPRRRCSSGGSVEFRAKPQLFGGGEETSPTSPHQLSVTWASQCDINEFEIKLKPMQAQLNTIDGRRKSAFQENKFYESPTNLANLVDSFADDQIVNDAENDCDEDYSLSVSAMMQRRVSVRGFRNKRGSRMSRRASSPMDHIFDTVERRRSSVYTTSSDEGTNQESTQEQIFENIRLHKEVIQSVKLQPWSMRKKMKLVRQAKTYVTRHEGALQERFAMSRSTRDLWARFKILMAARWMHWKRETACFLNVLIPWELRIKEIESHFGSGVASYFTFLRWLLWVNIVIAIPLVAFVIAPELLSTNPGETDPRKKMTDLEMKKAGDFSSYWEFEGYLKYSPLFYGYYSTQSGATKKGYNLPLAYFLTSVTVYIYSFVAILRKMAENSRNSKLSSKDDECIFSWKLFTGWDFMIGHAETAHNRIASVVVGFKEALLEEAEKKKDNRNWRIILQRVLVNIVILVLLIASGGAVVWAVGQTESIEPEDILPRNLVNYIITSLSLFLPIIFEALGLFENWHPRQQLRLQLARIMILNLLNLYSLMFSFIYKIDGKDVLLQLLKEQESNATSESDEIKRIIMSLATMVVKLPNGSFASSTSSLLQTNAGSSNSLIATAYNILNQTRCITMRVNCSIPKLFTNHTLTTSIILLNLSTTVIPTTMTTMWQTTTNDNFHPTSMDAISTSTTIDIDIEGASSSTTILLQNETTMTKTTDYTSEIVLPSSSSLSPVNDSYFEYHDYFDNLMSFDQEEQPGSDDYMRRNIKRRETTKLSTDNGNDDDQQIEDNFSLNLSSSVTFENVSMQNIEFENEMDNSQNSDVNQSEQRDEYSKLIVLPERNVRDSNQKSLNSISHSSVGKNVINDDDEDDNCTETVCTAEPPTVSSVKQYFEDRLANVTLQMESIRQNLSAMCWETTLGQELSKVIVLDMIMSIAASLCIDFLRALFVRYMNKHWCWDMEKTFPQYGDFKIAESILNLVYNQGQVWMGIFFSPGLVIINVVKLTILMYFRSWIVLTCNVPHEVVFKASKSNNFYLSLLLTMLFLCVLPVSYAIVWLRPSWHCGPYSEYNRISEFFSNTTITALPRELRKPWQYITSSSTVIPLLLLLILIIYYLVSLTSALREANQDLRTQLQKEREEERRKIFKMPEKQTNEQRAAALTNRWRKVLEASSPVTTITQPPDFDDFKTQARKELLSRIMKKALRKSSATSDEESMVRQVVRDDDDTDTEHQDSLPRDEDAKGNVIRFSRAQRLHRTPRKTSLVDIVQIAKSEREKVVAVAATTAAVRGETLVRGRFRIEKIESLSTNGDNNPEINSKIVSERNDSLLQKKSTQNGNDNADSSALPATPNSCTLVNEKIKLNEDRKKNHNSNEFSESHEQFPECIDDSKVHHSDRLVNFSKQSRKKLGSLLAMVREAVHMGKSDDNSTTINESLAETETEIPATTAIPNGYDVNSEVTTVDFNRASLEDGDEYEKRQIQYRTTSQRRKTIEENVVAMRQDSQTSTWSENIPTITISTTGSDECILKKNHSIPADATVVEIENEKIESAVNVK